MSRRLSNADVKQDDVFEAEWQPERTDDLRKPEMVGTRCQWTVLWMQEDCDPYGGTWVATPADPGVNLGGWAPVTDLVVP